MDIFGKIIQVLPKQSGVSKSGKDWKKQSYVLQTYEMYPKQICFEVFGDKIDYFQIKEGEDITVSVDVVSRMYNEKWFTSVTCWDVKKQTNAQQSVIPQQQVQQSGTQQQIIKTEEKNLPF